MLFSADEESAQEVDDIFPELLTDILSFGRLPKPFKRAKSTKSLLINVNNVNLFRESSGFIN